MNELPPGYAEAPAMLRESLRAAGQEGAVRVLRDKRVGLWEVQTYGRISKRWFFAFYWAHYPRKAGPPLDRPLPHAARPILEWLSRIDDNRFGRTPAKNRRMALAQMDESRARRLAAVQRQREDIAKTLGKDLALYKSGLRQTFAPGYIRSRRHAEHASNEMMEALVGLDRMAKE